MKPAQPVPMMARDCFWVVVVDMLGGFGYGVRKGKVVEEGGGLFLSFWSRWRGMGVVVRAELCHGEIMVVTRDVHGLSGW